MVHASDAYAPDADGRRPQWADVIRATVPRLERGGYDLLIVDSLARWMGNDSSNAAMLDALGALRQVTRLGVGVLAPHHCAKDAQAPYEPRGGSAILGELDLCWSLARLPGCSDPLHDPPAGLGVCQEPLRRADAPAAEDRAGGRRPAAPRPRYGYRLLDGARVWGAPPTAGARSQGVDALSDQQRRVLEALYRAPDHKATTPELATATGLDPNRVREATLALIKGGWTVVAGAGETPPVAGGPRCATRHALRPGAPPRRRRPSLRLRSDGRGRPTRPPSCCTRPSIPRRARAWSRRRRGAGGRP